ncbi:MAG: hypothetical protein ACTJHI_03870, partial [Psychrobacter sp.]|uniref:hypothetical protein n=1 Tax=Psychrobacter sp. TaxID=56811 RepID=UPI003F9E29D0
SSLYYDSLQTELGTRPSIIVIPLYPNYSKFTISILKLEHVTQLPVLSMQSHTINDDTPYYL